MGPENSDSYKVVNGKNPGLRPKLTLNVLMRLVGDDLSHSAIKSQI
jgi:hypothetical protein